MPVGTTNRVECEIKKANSFGEFIRMTTFMYPLKLFSLHQLSPGSDTSSRTFGILSSIITMGQILDCPEHTIVFCFFFLPLVEINTFDSVVHSPPY